jgi:hypothetical protein
MSPAVVDGAARPRASATAIGAIHLGSILIDFSWTSGDLSRILAQSAK